MFADRPLLIEGIRRAIRRAKAAGLQVDKGFSPSPGAQADISREFSTRKERRAETRRRERTRVRDLRQQHYSITSEPSTPEQKAAAKDLQRHIDRQSFARTTRQAAISKDRTVPKDPGVAREFEAAQKRRKQRGKKTTGALASERKSAQQAQQQQSQRKSTLAQRRRDADEREADAQFKRGRTQLLLKKIKSMKPEVARRMGIAAARRAKAAAGGPDYSDVVIGESRTIRVLARPQ